MRNERRTSILIGIFIIFFIGIGVFFCSYTATSAKEEFVATNVTEMAEWSYTLSNGSKGTVTLPHEFALVNGEAVSISATLPDTLSDGTFLCLNTVAYYHLYVDNVLRKSYTQKDVDIPGGAEKSVYFMIPLSAEDAGKTVTIVRDIPCLNYGYFRSMYVGDAYSIEHAIMTGVYPAFLLSLVLGIFGLMGFCYALALRVLSNQRISLIYISIGIIMIAAWLITDSIMFQWVFHQYYIDGVISFLIAALSPFPFMIYLDNLQKQRQHRILHWGEGLCLIFFVLLCMAHFCFGIGLLNHLLVFGAMMTIQILPFVFAIWKDYQQKQYKDYLIILIGLIIMLICSLLELILINLVENRIDGLLVLIALFVLMVCGLLQQTLDSSKLVSKLHQKTRELDQMSINAMVNMTRSITDPLTGIYNFRYVKEAVRKNLEKTAQGLFIMIDLDNFKQVNDTFGHKAGDDILIHFATILKEAFRDGDVVSRLGGDEFVVYVPGYGDKKLIEKKFVQICSECESDEVFAMYGSGLSLSMGIAIAPADGTTWDELYRAADKAMYAVKRKGKNGYCFVQDMEI